MVDGYDPPHFAGICQEKTINKVETQDLASLHNFSKTHIPQLIICIDLP
jgi:hypothetical protein